MKENVCEQKRLIRKILRRNHRKKMKKIIDDV